jgi:hypothetical protein
MGNAELVASAERLQLVASIFFWATLVGIGVLTLARGRRWTPPAWAFVAAPWPLFAVWLAALFSWRAALEAPGPAVGRGAGLPPQGPFAGLAATATAIAAVAMLVGFVVLMLVAPPRRAWTRRGGMAAVAAAVLSWGWCLVLSRIDPETLPSTPYQAFTITVPDGFTGRAWVFEDKKSGTPPRWVLGSARYALPKNGVLVTRDIGPLRATPRVFWPRGVSMRTTAGARIPWVGGAAVCDAHRWKQSRRGRYEKPASDRPPMPQLCWSVELGRSFDNAGGFEELLIGDPEWMAGVFLEHDQRGVLRGTDVLWWNDRADRQLGPLESVVNGAAVEWQHVVSEDLRHAFATTWTPGDAAEEALRFELVVTRDRNPRERNCRMTVAVCNAGNETVDGWELAFSTLFAVRLDGSYTYYSQQVQSEERVPCTPFLPRPARRARHSFFRRHGTRPLGPGEKEEFQFDIVDDRFEPKPRLPWAQSLAPPLE